MTEYRKSPERKKELLQIIGNHITELRRLSSMTQEKLADELDVSVQYISKLERGKIGLSIFTLLDLCRILHVSPDYILLEKETTDSLKALQNRLQSLKPSQMEIINRALQVFFDAVDQRE